MPADRASGTYALRRNKEPAGDRPLLESVPERAADTLAGLEQDRVMKENQLKFDEHFARVKSGRALAESLDQSLRQWVFLVSPDVYRSLHSDVDDLLDHRQPK